MSCKGCKEKRKAMRKKIRELEKVIALAEKAQVPPSAVDKSLATKETP